MLLNTITLSKRPSEQGLQLSIIHEQKHKSTKKGIKYIERGLAKLWVPADPISPISFSPKA